MERDNKSPDRKSFSKELNDRFETHLELWKMGDSKINMSWLNQELSIAKSAGLDLTLKVYAKSLATSEGSRAVLPNDLKKWFKREGEFLVTNINPKGEAKGNAKIKVVRLGGNDVLVIMNNEYGAYSLEASFFPQEVASIEVR